MTTEKILEKVIEIQSVVYNMETNTVANDLLIELSTGLKNDIATKNNKANGKGNVERAMKAIIKK